MADDKDSRKNVEAPGRRKEEKENLKNTEPRPAPGSKPTPVPPPVPSPPKREK